MVSPFSQLNDFWLTIVEDMDNKSLRKEVEVLCKKLGVQEISHRRPLNPEILISDLKKLAARLGHPLDGRHSTHKGK
jgi:hypothetical protein